MSIAPHLGALKHVNATMPTPAGAISVDYQRTANSIAADITLPEGTSAELVCGGQRMAVKGHQKLTCPLDKP